MFEIAFFLFAPIISWIVASKRGRWGFGYFLLSYVFTPVLIVPLLLVLPPKYDGDIRITE